MAQFTTDVQPVQTPMSPTGGVVDNSTANALGSAGNVVAGLGEGLFGSKAIAMRKAIDKGTENSYIASYEQQQLKLANAVDQGSMSSDEARMRMRANYSNALANFHGDPDDLAAAHARIVNNSGLGKVIETGTKKEQLTNTLVTDAAKAGWITPDMDSAQQQVALSHYQQFQQATAQLGASQQQIAYKRAQIGLQSDQIQLGTARINQQAAGVSLSASRIALAEKQQEMQSRTAMGQLQDSYNFKFQTGLNDIQKRLDAHQIDQKQATMEVQQQLATATQMAGGIGANAGSEYINNMLTPMKMRAENMLSYISGDMDNKLLDANNHKAEAVQTALVLGDPESAKIVAVSHLFPNAPYAVQKVAGDMLLNNLKKGGSNGKPPDLLPDDPKEKEGVKGYLETLKSGMAQSEAGTLKNPDATRAEINQNLVQTMRAIPAYGQNVDPKEYNDLVDFMASPEFGKYVAKNGGIPQEAVGPAGDVIKQQYSDHVMPLLMKEYQRYTAGSNTMVDAANSNPFSLVDSTPTRTDTTGQKIHPEFVGAGVSFVTNDPKDGISRDRVKELNKNVAPILNRLVRMSAHLSGNMNYKKAYDENYAKYFEPAQDNTNGNGG